MHSVLIELQDSKEGFLRHFNIAYLFHSLLTAFLLFQQFALTADVTTIALGCHVLAHLLHRLAGNDLGTDGSLTALS